jgi:hypothetical protein
MAGLAPSLRLVLGAHNVAVSDPRKLPALQEAVRQVRAGRATGTGKEGDRIEFGFDGFSLLVAKPLLAGRQGDRTRGGSGLTTWN